ncbi:SPOC domain protein [Ostertagia ostertagi]
MFLRGDLQLFNLSILISSYVVIVIVVRGQDRDFRRSPDAVNLCGGISGSSVGSVSVCASAHSSGGLQGVYVERLPPRSDGTVKEAIRDALKKHGRIVDISIEGDGDARKALVIFQRVIDMEKLVNDSHISILSMRVRIRAANHVVVQVSFDSVCEKHFICLFWFLWNISDRAHVVSSVVGKSNSDGALRRRFGNYGTILDVDFVDWFYSTLRLAKICEFRMPSALYPSVFKVESGEARVPADFCSDRLHDHFIDRKHGGIPVKNPVSLPTTPTIGSGCISVGGSSVQDEDSLTALLAPPPDPPSDMPSLTKKLITIVTFSLRKNLAGQNVEKRGVLFAMNTPACDHAVLQTQFEDVGNDPGNGPQDTGLGPRTKKAFKVRLMIKDYPIERKKGRKQMVSASSDSFNCHQVKTHLLTRLRSASTNSRAIRSKPRNTSSSRRSPFEVSKWTDRKTTRHSPAADDRLPQTMQASSVSAAIGTITPTPDDRKSGDSGFYDDVSRPPLDPPPAPPQMETLPQIPSPPPADPPVRRKPSPRSNSHSQHCTPHFVSPPSTSRHDSYSSRHQSHHFGQEPQSISVQHRHQSLSSGPGPSTATPSNFNSSSHSQKRHSVDGQGSHLRPHSTSQPSHRTRTGKWPWNDLLRNPCVFPDIATTSLTDPRIQLNESPKLISSHLPLPPFASSADRHPRSVAGEWRKRSSGSAASTEGGYTGSQRRASGGSGIISCSRPLASSLSEERASHLHTPAATQAAHTHATVSRSPSSSGGSGGMDSDAQLSPDAAPLPPPPPSALDLLCEPDDVPILADGWSGRLAEIGSRLTDVNASLEEAHRGVAELDDQHHRHPTTSLATETTPTSSRHRQSGAPSTTHRTDSFEERLRSINQKKKSSFDDFTLNITQERILAAKASAPDPLSVAPFPVISSGSGLSSSGFSRNAASHRPALSITIPQPGSASQSAATTPASTRIDSPLSSRKSGAPCSSASTSRPPASAHVTSSSTPPVRLAAPPTAPLIAYPPNFSVPPPNFSATSSSVCALSTTPESQTSPILSAPPPPPQLLPTTQHTPQRHDSMSALKSPVPGTAPSLTGRSLSVSDARKSGTPTVAHKDPSTELLAELFHNKPPTTDFRKLPKIEKKPSAVAAHPEREHHSHEQSKKHSGSLDHHKKEKEHKMRRKDDGSFETKEERAKRKEAERSKKDREKTKDQKKEKKAKEERKRGREDDREKKDRKRKRLRKSDNGRRNPRSKRKNQGRAHQMMEVRAMIVIISKQLAHLVAEDSGSSCAGASGGLSMYDRVKRRSSAANKDDGTKKTAALQRLRDKNNERKNQKRHRIQLDSSDEEDEGPRPIRKPAESEPDDSSEEEEETVRVGKSANGNSSEDEEVKKKRDYSTDESGESDGGDRKQQRRPTKKTSEKHKHVAKNINMEDVFGADSTDNEKLSIEEKEKKRKKSRKFIRAFTESKPAKRTKKSQQSDESSASEMDIQSVMPKVEEEQSQCSVISAKVEEPAIKEEIIEVKPEEVPMETEVTEQVKTEQEPEEENKEAQAQHTLPEAETETSIAPKPPQQPTSTATEQARPKLLTKAAMKIFVPSQSTIATSTVSATQPSTEADSDDESTDYDDVFASALSAPTSAQHDATATTFLPPVRRVSTSSSGATEPDEVSESDSDSQRSRHRAVELVDATAGYASVHEPPVANVDETTTSSDECSATKTSLTVTSLQEPLPTSYTDSVKDTTEQSSSCEQQEAPHDVVETTVQAPPAPETTTTPCEQPSVDDEAKKTARGISDLQETEDAVKSIFDGDDEEEEPQYPTLVFVPGKNGAVVASAGLSTAGEAVLVSTSVAVTNEETNRATSAIADVDDEAEITGIASGDVSDEQLLRESFVEEPILEEKPAAEKNAEVSDAAKEGSSADAAPNVIVIEDDDIVEIPTTSSSVKEQDPIYTSVSQPVTANVTAPISVAIPEPRKASTPMQSPKTVTSAEQATFVPPPVVHSVKASPVPSSEYVSVLPAASPVSGGITQGTPVVSQAGMHQLYNRFQQPSFTHANVLQQQQQLYQQAQAQAQHRPLSQQQLFQQQFAQQQLVLQQQQQQQLLAQQQLELQQQRERAAPVNQHQHAALAAQATLQMQLQQMQMLQMASRDPVAYYQQMSQTFGQPMATALLAQLQAIQQLPTSQAQQYLLELQRQQQIKTSPAVPQTPISTASSQGNISIVQQERKNVSVPPQPRTIESSVSAPLAAAVASPSGTSSQHSADVAKRSRKATEPQHLSSFGLSSPEVEAMNPSGNALSGDSQGVGDHTLNILNLAGAIAMNSLLAINQQNTGAGGFPAQLAAQNPLLANAAKVMLSMNLANAAAAGADRPSASTSTSELLSLVASQPETTALTVANLQQAMLLQQYAALARGQIPGVNPQLAALHMSLKRTAENGTGHQSDRKRSFPSSDVPNQVEELRKRVHSDSIALAKQRKTEHVMVPRMSVSKDDMERCLNRILNEEIYNIYDHDLKPERKPVTPVSSPVGSSKGTGCSSSSGTSSPFERKLCIDEILEIIANRPLDKEGGIASLGSAFRKVSSRSNTADSCSREISMLTDSALVWETSLSPDGSSPRYSEPDVAPLTQELVTSLRNLAISHRDEDPENLDSDGALTYDEQLKRFPVVWQGTLAMKQSETTVQMHLVYGSIEMLTRCLGDANADAKNAVPIRVNQRMRLEHAQVQVAGMVAKMSDAGRFACMICLPCGLSRDEIITNSDIFRTAFIDYFTSKQAAGIAVMPQTATTAGCLVHVFPPGEFPSSYLQYYSPQLYESITARQASFLFVVLTPDESSRPLTS